MAMMESLAKSPFSRLLGKTAKDKFPVGKVEIVLRCWFLLS
jgi:hypothetical protein